MVCPPVRGDNPRDLASGLSYVQVDKNGITIRGVGFFLMDKKPFNENE